MDILYPKEVEIVLNELKYNNFNGFIVGGCVRDSVLGFNPNDWDITTDATPRDILTVFKDYKTIQTGIKHGTITVIVNNKFYEITTFRIDGNYMDNRRPKDVEFTNDIVSDLRRRDFTVNAIAYNKLNGIVDPFEGIRDIKNKIIKTVGESYDRFNEDSLRILRGIRFSVKLGFEIDTHTLNSMKENSHLLINISKERIRDEFIKILLSPYPSKGIRLLVELGLMKHIIPELNDTVGFNQHNVFHDKDVFEHTLEVLENTDSILVLRLSALLHDIAKPNTFELDDNGNGHFYKHNIVGMKMSVKILRNLKFDNKTIDIVKILVKEHMYKNDNLSNKSIKKFILRIGEENLENFFKLQIADRKGSKDKNIEDIIKLNRKCIEIINMKEPVSIKDLNITGREIIELGFKEGKFVGEILNYLLEEVLENSNLNTKEKLKEIVIEKYKGSINCSN